MSTLYVTEPRATLRLDAATLIVTRDGEAGRREELLRVAPARLELVGLVGDVHVTGDATRLCLDEGVAVAWFTAGGRFRGRLLPAAPRSADLRLCQYAAWQDQAGRLARARAVVAAKVGNAARVLSALASNYPGHPALAAAAEVRELHSRIEAAVDRDQLLGLEGIAARRYFQGLAAAFRADIVFTGREQHPPPDPANAVLSLGYVLLGNELAGLLEARGLDPALGFFHEVRSGRPSLALDLLEEFRHPVVDRFVLRLCNLRVLRPEHFETDAERPGGVRLSREGQRRFFPEWEKFLQQPLREREVAEPVAVRPLLRRQVERLVADLRGGAPYCPVEFGD